MKQSMNTWLPVLNTQVDFTRFVLSENPGFIAHCIEREKIPLKNALFDTMRITILVGPEGDFTETELQSATEKNWKPVSLGNTRLRTETAGIVAAHTVIMVNGK
jgi:16S rRNA (uracil1498-N3)-methyltransferase